jgi:hypothetical protein
MWQSFWANSRTYADIATVATSIIAALAAVFTLGIYFGQRISDRRSFAKGLVREYVQVALENPRFANPQLAEIDFAARTFDGSREDFEKYERFVDFVLWTDEEVLSILKDDRWRASVRQNLGEHRAYLQTGIYGDYAAFFSPELVLLIRQVVEGVRSPAAAEA